MNTFPTERHAAALTRITARLGIDPDALRSDLAALPHEQREIMLCAMDRQYFITRYCQIYDGETNGWIAFNLWPEQIAALDAITDNQRAAVLKARQVGLTWLCLAYALHEMLFRPIAVVLLFSKRENEAIYLLSQDRLRGMFDRLPKWMQPAIAVDAATTFILDNGSAARAFPSNAGDSYTATFALIDEADLVPDLNDLMARVQPTIDAGGKLALISRADKSKPRSLFKQIYRNAVEGVNGWAHAFIPWHTRPSRSEGWYAQQCQAAMRNEGTLDSVYEQYPATAEEALAERTLDKRLNPAHVRACFVPVAPLADDVIPGPAPTIPGLRLYVLPDHTRQYIIGADPAEGNPTSDDSALHVMDYETGEEVAELSGKFEPAILAAHADRIGRYYYNAALMVERNNHGHAVLLWLRDNSRLARLLGHDNKEGWHSTTRGKALLYDAASDTLRASEAIIHSRDVYEQIASIEGASLRAPDGLMDDKADAWALANVGRKHATSAHLQSSSGGAMNTHWYG